MLKPKTRFAVIVVEFDPETETDYLDTRTEEITDTLAEAERFQTELLRDRDLISSTRLHKRHFRCYIQERDYYTVPTTKGKTEERYRIVRVLNLKEI